MASRVNKKNRKPLAQGRLVTEPSNNAVKKKLPGVKVTESLKNDDDEHNTASVTPRKIAPSHNSQISPKPAPSLDLSDIDSEINDNANVVVMDASENFLDEDSAEVSVNIGIEKSPIRVVRHIESEALRERNENVKREGNKVNKLKQSSSLHAISPLHKDRPKSASKHSRTPLRKTAGTPNKAKPNYPQPNFNDSDEGSVKGDVDDDNQSVTSELGACSIDEYIPVIKSKGTQNQKSQNAKLKMKTASTIIPSRYMQSASKTSTSSKEKNTSRSNKSVTKGLTVSNRSSSQTRTTPTLPRKSTPASNIHQQSSSSRAVTPSLPSSQTVGGKTSTPCSDTVNNQPQEFDASAIQAEISAISADLSTLNNTRKVNNSSMNVSKKSHPKKPDLKASQRKLEIQYARYLQWLYLDCRATKAFKEQEKSAMSQIHSLWEEVEILREKEAGLKLDLARLQHLNRLDDQLEIQRNGLGDVVNNLSVLEKDYNNLAESLDTTRHQIVTRGIYIPDDEDQYQASLESALKESEYLLGEISCLVRQEMPKTTQFSTSLQTTERVVDTECSELRRCTELLSAAQSLTVQESSLKIQAMQSN